MYLAIITLPLLGSIASGLFGRKIGVTGAQLITSSLVILTTLLAIAAYFEVGLNSIPVSIKLFTWIDSESLNVFIGFHFDSLTVSMLIPVLLVSSLVHIYSVGYMRHDPHVQRFFSYLSLFTFMMIILITANNFLLMFVGWEGSLNCLTWLVQNNIAIQKSSITKRGSMYNNEKFNPWFVSGFSDGELKNSFPGITPVSRPVIELPQSIDSFWLAGFTAGEACFHINIFKSKASNSGIAVRLRFQITQHLRDAELISSLIKYWGCGNVYEDSSSSVVVFVVSNLSDINNKILPFFDQYTLQWNKKLDYLDFCKVVEIMKVKAHLTEEGLDQIRVIKRGMNLGRD